LGPCRYFLFLYLLVSKLWKKDASPKISEFEFESEASNGQVECQVSETNGNLGRCQNCAEHKDSIKDEEEAKHWEPLMEITFESMTLAAFIPFQTKPHVSYVKDTRFHLHLSDGLGAAGVAGGFSMAAVFMTLWGWYADVKDNPLYNPPYTFGTLVKKFKIKLEDPYSLACDGEIIDGMQSVYLKVQRGLVEVCGTGSVESHPDIDYVKTLAKWRCMLVAFIFALVCFLFFSVYALRFVVNRIY
jgi:hypothetical protein